MKCTKMIVPRSLIKHHLPHPEIYGESIVELLNGMVTDVFTVENGDLITETNNLKLIEYLNQNDIHEACYVLEKDTIRIRSINQSDLEIVLSWMNQKTIYSFNDIMYEFEDIRIFISHAISNASHLFIIEKENMPIGTAGYDTIDLNGIIDIKIYEKEIISSDYEATIINLLSEHIHKMHRINGLSSIVFKDDHYSHQLFTKNGFYKNEEDSLELPISYSSFKKADIYKYKSFDIQVKESEKRILNEFLQLYPKKLYDLANPDEHIDLEHAIDYELKIYIRLVLTNQLNFRDEFEEICVNIDELLNIEDNLIEKYDEMMTFLSGEDLNIAIMYKQLIFPVLEIINKYIKIYQEKQIYHFIANSTY
ncbi:MAG: GNAT family N-acetyltransferase [Acholeplasmataceae bacterium]|nr:GNAT family N-acetyltransferase [Acholeplasmataceae bacterium]